MTYTKEQLIDAISAEYDFYCQDDFNPEKDLSSDEMKTYLMGLTYEKLVEETGCDEIFTIDEFMSSFGEESK